MRRGIVALGLLLLSACSFASENPLFNESEGVAVFGQRQVMRWTEQPSGDIERIAFARQGNAYLMAPTGEDERIRVFFAPIAETPEDDYVAQTRIDPEGQGIVYAFVWRTADGFRVISTPASVGEDGATSPFCTALAYQQCEFKRREDVIGYYRESVYPRFVAGSEMPASYIDLTPDTGRTK